MEYRKVTPMTTEQHQTTTKPADQLNLDDEACNVWAPLVPLADVALLSAIKATRNNVEGNYDVDLEYRLMALLECLRPWMPFGYGDPSILSSEEIAQRRAAEHVLGKYLECLPLNNAALYVQIFVEEDSFSESTEWGGYYVTSKADLVLTAHVSSLAHFHELALHHGLSGVDVRFTVLAA